jgi:hypothetical protein
MANTYVDYTATAAQTDFAFSFPYLEDEHVTVEINGVATTDFTIVTTPATKVVLNSGATVGQIVRVRRKSQPDANLVDFVNGSVLTESELDRAYLHNRYLAEEIAELNDASLQIQQGSTQWDAKSLQIKNVATPTATTDASTKSYVDDKVNQVSSGAAFPPTKWTFTGTAGANTTYSVTGAEVNGDTAYDVSIDGAVQEPTTDFTVDPDTDTLTIVATLTGSEDIVVIQRGFGIAVATGTIGSSQIANGSITEAKIATDAVTNTKIDDGAVTATKIGTDAVTTVKIEDGAVTAAKLGTDAVTSAKIENGAITHDKISTTDAVFNINASDEVGIGRTAVSSYGLAVAGGVYLDNSVAIDTYAEGDESVKALTIQAITTGYDTVANAIKQFRAESSNYSGAIGFSYKNNGFYSTPLKVGFHSSVDYSNQSPNRNIYHILCEQEDSGASGPYTLATGNPLLQVIGNGDVANKNNSYGSTSDSALKKDIVDANSQWTDIKNVSVKNYKLKSETEADSPVYIGVVAQDLESAGMNGLVDDSGKYKTVKYSILYMKAIKALQEAMDRIEVLEAKVEALQA